MQRRGVPLLLMPFVLLTQSAALGHHHEGTQPEGHEHCPHIHLKAASNRHHDHVHQHGHGGHCHHDDDADDEPGSSPATAEQEPASDHDEDVLYVLVDAIASGRMHGQDGVVLGPFWFVPSLNVVAGLRDGLDEHELQWPHPPPLAVTSDRPLYLRHLALLI